MTFFKINLLQKYPSGILSECETLDQDQDHSSSADDKRCHLQENENALPASPTYTVTGVLDGPKPMELKACTRNS